MKKTVNTSNTSKNNVSHTRKTHKKQPVHHTKAKKTKKHVKNKVNHKGVLFILAIVAVILILFFILRNVSEKEAIVATVNGENIFASDVEKINMLSAQQMTEEEALESIIIERILVQEAKSKNFKVDSNEIDSALEEFKNSLPPQDSFEDFIEKTGLELDFLRDRIMTNLLIVKLLNKTLPEADVTDDEVKAFFDINSQQGDDFEELKEEIKMYLGIQKQQEMLMSYITELMLDANIKYKNADKNKNSVSGVSSGKVFSFEDNGDFVCEQDGKPIVRMFSSTWCPHCKWIKDSFDSVVKEYVDSGKIIAYHWELDIGDDTLTPEKELEVPAEELAVFQEFNPTGGVPTFIFGCKYIRIGTAYEAANDLASEESDFKSVIELMI